MNPQFLHVRDMQIAYYEKNPEQKRTIVFLHGNSSSSRSWNGQWESPLLDGYRLVAVDLPGHGASGQAPNPSYSYTIKGLAVLLADVIDMLATGPYVLCATSLATNFVAEMIPCGIDPAGILLEGASVMGEGVGIEKIALPGADISAITQDDVTKEAVEAYSRFAFHVVNAEMRNQFIDDFLNVQAPFRTILIGSIFSGQMSDQIKLMGSLSCPVMYVYGAEERVVNLGYLEQADIPKWQDQIFLIPDAGHLAHVEQAEAFNVMLAGFAEKCL
jgi:pimeloyl-ACP methyl ester carboxylesterase